MDNELYVKNDGDVKYWTREQLLTRAEAAETDLRELRENTLLALGFNPVDVADGTEDATIAYLLSGLRERVQELEAQLAAQAWRPVTDEEPESSQLVELLVLAYRDDWGDWVYPDGTIPVKAYREIDPPTGGDSLP